jgi:hypothetical protein
LALNNQVCDDDKGLVLYDVYCRRDFEKSYKFSEDQRVVPAGASLHVFIHNLSQDSSNIEDLKLNGESIETLVNSKKIYWSDINPKHIKPNAIACIKLRFADFRDYDSLNELTIDAVSDNGRIFNGSFNVGEGYKNIYFSYVGYNQGLDRAYIYINSVEPGRGISGLKEVWWDGINVTTNVIEEIKIAEERLLIILEFSEPLKAGTYSTIKTVLKEGDSISYQVRALSPEFPVGMYGAFHEAGLRSYKEHGADLYLSFPARTIEDFDLLVKTGMKGLAPLKWDKDDSEITALVQKMTEHPGVLGFYIMDEPDVHDYRAGGLGSTGPEVIRRTALIRDSGTCKPIWLAIDNTFRPGNWYVYSEIADINIGHRYPVSGGFLGDMGHADIVRRVVITAAPRPTYSIAQFFTFPPKPTESIEGKKLRKIRMPVPEEMLLQVFMAYAKGAKGMSYYIHSGSKVVCGGTVPELYESIKGINALAKTLSSLTSIGDWVPFKTSCNREGIEVDTILLGDEGVLVFLTNLEFESAIEGFSCTPQENVKVRVQLSSDFSKFGISDIYLIREDKFLSIGKGESTSREISINLNKLALAEVFYIRFCKEGARIHD